MATFLFADIALCIKRIYNGGTYMNQEQDTQNTGSKRHVNRKYKDSLFRMIFNEFSEAERICPIHPLYSDES